MPTNFEMVEKLHQELTAANARVAELEAALNKISATPLSSNDFITECGERYPDLMDWLYGERFGIERCITIARTALKEASGDE